MRAKGHRSQRRLTRKPLLLFRHRRRIGGGKSKGIESIVEYEIIQFSRQRLLDDYRASSNRCKASKLLARSIGTSGRLSVGQKGTGSCGYKHWSTQVMGD
jgi:hypothetical protein